MIDCGDPYNLFGCSHGVYINAIKYVAKEGLSTEQNYPYTGKYYGKCHRKNKSEADFTINGFKQILYCPQISNQLAEHPIPVFIDGTSWRFYKEGVFSDCVWDFNHNHAALIVGMTDGNWKLGRRRIYQTSWG